jgi:hypothetical protein
VHVPLRRGDVGVAGQLLNRPRRRAAHREMRTERVPKPVRPAALEPRAPRGSYDAGRRTLTTPVPCGVPGARCRLEARPGCPLPSLRVGTV